YPYEDITRNAILEICSPGTGRVDKVCQLNFYLGKLFADAAKSIANKARIAITDIDLIGSHGQTIYHLPNQAAPEKTEDRSRKPEPGNNKSNSNLINTEDFKRETWYLPFLRSTLQIGEPSVIAQETGVTTVADFRPRDIAAGGQGAPLVPCADYILFRDKEKGRALQNIGGIANVTFLPRDCNIHDVIAFDTGPGNMVIDRITELITNDAFHFDEGGKLAAKGKVDEHLLAILLAHPYLSKLPPKTTGREEFGRPFADNLYKDATHSGIEGPDILATVTAFTARTIADSYKQWILPKHHLSEVILSGGGSHNNTLIKFLIQEFAPSMKIHSINTFGIASTAKEALAFAILANETISGNPNNIPNATGAREAVIMGKIIP
ncbi:partial Anhydro-N-acetylmuramic acid kinase, partial [Candidatus Brocadiaceae bacterium]